jgi:hypothetical protein
MELTILSNFQGDKMIFRDVEYERNEACRKNNPLYREMKSDFGVLSE